MIRSQTAINDKGHLPEIRQKKKQENDDSKPNCHQWQGSAIHGCQRRCSHSQWDGSQSKHKKNKKSNKKRFSREQKISSHADTFKCFSSRVGPHLSVIMRRKQKKSPPPRPSGSPSGSPADRRPPPGGAPSIRLLPFDDRLLFFLLHRRAQPRKFFLPNHKCEVQSNCHQWQGSAAWDSPKKKTRK